MVLSEDDVRRIVREEIERAFERVSNSLYNSRDFYESELDGVQRRAREDVASALRISLED